MKRRLSRVAGTMAALGLLALPALAQDHSGAKVLPPAALASAAIRQDMIRGVYETAEAPDLGALFVASTPSFDARTPGYVDLLDAADLRPIRRIELPRRAFALAMDHKRGRLIVGNTLDGSLSVLDARSGVLLEVIQLGKPEGDGFEHTRMIEIDGESGRVFVSSPSEAGTLWIVDTAAGNAVTRIDDAGLWAAGLAHDPASGRVYVSGGGMNEILIVDGRSGARVGTLSTGDTTEPGQDASKHFFINLALDAKGERLFAADANSGQLYVFDIASGKAVKTVPIGLGVLDVTYVPQSDQIFVTYRGVDREHPEGSGGLVVLDGSDYAPQVSIPLPVHPNSLSVGDKGKTLFVTVKAPMEKEHPAYREGAADSVLRIDLAALNAAIR